ncbi:2788_t:CDS:2 [Funneliformis caledonium]|uniref:2788_t:CDS:1 n=1 Tax=Funneliformis caledonium TaxID=1117310 RepID=A0A9N9DPL9_9GLOM|nr:2788_t:CDS:2 [Funneliformis caledonium]
MKNNSEENSQRKRLRTVEVRMVEDRDIIQDNESLILELIDTRKSLTNSEAQRIKYVKLIKEYERRIPRTCPNFAIKSHQFRVQIRRTQFIYSNQNFQNITGEWMLSEELKKFSKIAYIKRAEFIKAVLIDKSSLGIWHLIPIIRDEMDFQQYETSLTKIEILTIINSLIPSLDDLN